jgi:hypothetical protein
MKWRGLLRRKLEKHENYEFRFVGSDSFKRDREQEGVI